MFCRFCTCATFRDRKGARWLTPQLLPSAPPVNQHLVQLQGLKNTRCDVTNESPSIKFFGDYFCRRLFSTTPINRCTPTLLSLHQQRAIHSLTFVYEWQCAVLISSIGSAVVAGGVQVDHEVGLLPAVLLQSAPQLLVSPHCLQHQAGATHLPLWTITVGQNSKETEFKKYVL